MINKLDVKMIIECREDMVPHDEPHRVYYEVNVEVIIELKKVFKNYISKEVGGKEMIDALETFLEKF